ncbi:MAG: RNA polymerase sigma-54 factor, partial [Paracoccaceae bacterium]
MTTRSRITIQQTQRLSLNTQLISSIQMLGSDAVGLSRYLEEAAVENPQLVVEPARVAEWLPRWSGAFARLASGGAWEDAVADPTSPSLLAHVGAQMATLRLNGAEAQVADLLAHGLEPSGWLGRPLDGVAAEAGVPLAMVEAVLARLQTLEPTGIFARTLAECLRLQAEEAGWLTPLARGVLDQLALVAV